jgi:hypothetical protein
MKTKNTIKTIFVASVILMTFFSFFHPVFAASYTNQEKIPGSEVTSDFITYLKSIINFGFAIIGILALFMLIIGAYQYLMAVGSGKAEGAKETIASALLGLVLGLTAWIILLKINPDLVAMREITKIAGTTPDGTPVTPPVTPPGTIPDSLKERISKYDDAVKKYSQQYGVDANIIRGIIEQESNWDPSAIGRSGDYGIMQINKKSHPSFFASSDWSNYDSNIGYGTKYFSNILNNNAGGDVRTALAMYNGGPGNPQYGYADKVLTRTQKYKNSGY